MNYFIHPNAGIFNNKHFFYFLIHAVDEQEFFIEYANNSNIPNPTVLINV